MNRRGFLASLTAALAARGIVAKTPERATGLWINTSPVGTGTRSAITGRRVLFVCASNPATLVLLLMRRSYAAERLHLESFQNAIDHCERHSIRFSAELPPNATVSDIIEWALKSFGGLIWWHSVETEPPLAIMAMRRPNGVYVAEHIDRQPVLLKAAPPIARTFVS